MIGRTSMRVLAACIISGAISGQALGDDADTMHLTDEPGNWFKSETTGTPLSVISAGDRVDFKIDNCCTSTRHKVTLLVKPVGSAIALDQDKSQHGAEAHTEGATGFSGGTGPKVRVTDTPTDRLSQVCARRDPSLAHRPSPSEASISLSIFQLQLRAGPRESLSKWRHI